MRLSQRKEKIIEAVVDRYINYPEPISSSDIQKNYLPEVSSATIRTELAILEGMGYLVQPHTSSGRIPTAEGYRLYVEKLMPTRKLSKEELKIIKRYFSRKLTELDEILRCTAKVISEVTNLTSVTFVDKAQEAIIENVKIVKVSEKLALVIVVTDRGIIKDMAASLGSDVTDEYLKNASDFAASVFRGKKVSEVANCEKLIKQVKKEYSDFFSAIVKVLKNYVFDDSSSEIVLEGSAKILEQPEYSNINKAKAMLELLDAKEALVPVLKNNDNMQLSILISRDDEIKKGAPECAIVTANYAVNGQAIGKAGVIGPIRMDYSKVVSVLDHISKAIEENSKEVEK